MSMSMPTSIPVPVPEVDVIEPGTKRLADETRLTRTDAANELEESNNENYANTANTNLVH